MKKKQLLALGMAFLLSISLLAGCGNSSTGTDSSQNSSGDSHSTENDSNATGPSAEPTDNPYGLREDTEDGTILHCFSWSFKTITAAMEDIAMAGYSSIQTSPINACYDGGTAGMDLYGAGKWYYHYQPTDWTIGNYQLGTREEFKEMCDVAESYGIKVIVDVAPNHTTTTTDALGQGLLDAVGGIDNLYHSNGFTDITNYSDRYQCTLQAMGGLPDVNTENPAFQNYFIAFLNDVIACGADGFRYDTAKHIGLSDDPQDNPEQANNFWNRVTTEVTNADSLFMYGECLQDGSERLSDYIQIIGATTASSYGDSIRGIFNGSAISAETAIALRIGNAAPNVVTWVESHDNYTGTEATYKTLTNDEVARAWSFLAARSTGTPLFFARPYGASAANMWGTFNKIGMAGDNLYKDSLVVAANHFRNAMVGLDENIFNPEGDSYVIFVERGTKGLYICNNGNSPYNMDITTKLEDGTYVDRVGGETFTVTNGKITGKLASKQVVILYNEGYVDMKAAALVKVSDDTTGTIYGDYSSITLVAENTTKATYSIDGGDEIAFKNGDIISIGEGIKASETTTLTLRGENADGKKTCITYSFKKQESIAVGTKVYFEKPANWGDTIYAYVYDETTSSSVIENAAWPGIPMQLEADGTYSYTFDKEWFNPLIIFTDGTNQSNGQLAPGHAIIADKVYTVSK